MDRFYVLIIIVPIIVIEIFIKIYEMMKLQERIKFFNEFFEKFVEYSNSKGKNNEAYSWLIRQSNKMQRELGIFGYIDYKPAGANYYVNNYPLIVNGLTEMKFDYANNFEYKHAEMVHEALLRYSGWLEESIEFLKKGFFNPLVLLKDGITHIFNIPLAILREIGVVSSVTYYKINNSSPYKLLSKILSLMTFLSVIITIFTGWNSFINIIKNIF